MENCATGDHCWVDGDVVGATNPPTYFRRCKHCKKRQRGYPQPSMRWYDEQAAGTAVISNGTELRYEGIPPSGTIVLRKGEQIVELRSGDPPEADVVQVGPCVFCMTHHTVRDPCPKGAIREF